MKRLAPKNISTATLILLKKQGGTCPICAGKLGTNTVKRPALDHDHTTGYIRDVLCINCNGLEGKLFNLTRRFGKHMTPELVLQNILAYWLRHKVPQHGGFIHPTHKTAAEKRLATLKRAAAKRKKAK